MRVEDLRQLCESPFEREMYDELTQRGYLVTPQVRVGRWEEMIDDLLKSLSERGIEPIGSEGAPRNLPNCLLRPGPLEAIYFQAIPTRSADRWLRITGRRTTSCHVRGLRTSQTAIQQLCGVCRSRRERST